MTIFQQQLAMSGLILFALGLINGFMIPKTPHPRLALSAHLTAVQSGTFLIAMAWMWPMFSLSDQISALIAWMLIASLFLLWFAILMSAFWGAGRDLPIAAQGAVASAVKQNIATALLYLSSVVSFLTLLFLIAVWVIY